MFLFKNLSDFLRPVANVWWFEHGRGLANRRNRLLDCCRQTKLPLTIFVQTTPTLTHSRAVSRATYSIASSDAVTGDYIDSTILYYRDTYGNFVCGYMASCINIVIYIFGNISEQTL